MPRPLALLALGACADPLPEAERPGAPTGLTSATTDLVLDACDVLATFEEGGGVEMRCAGYQGTDLFVSEGDLRFDVDAGVPNDRFDTAPASNTLGETIEWRLRDGAPFALIVRYLGDDGRGGGSSDLAVISVGTAGAPGRLVGWVPASAAPSQNAAARALADAQADAVDCAA